MSFGGCDSPVRPKSPYDTLTYYRQLRKDHRNRTGKDLKQYDVSHSGFLDLIAIQEFVIVDKFVIVTTQCVYCKGTRNLMDKHCVGCGAPLGSDGLCGMLDGIPVYLNKS